MMDSIQLPQIIQLGLLFIMLIVSVMAYAIYRFRRHFAENTNGRAFLNCHLTLLLAVDAIAINIIFYVQREMAGAGL